MYSFLKENLFLIQFDCIELNLFFIEKLEMVIIKRYGFFYYLVLMGFIDIYFGIFIIYLNL